MNKKKSFHTALITIILAGQSSFGMHQAAAKATLEISTLTGALTYGIIKILGLHEMYKSENVPPIVEEWARNLLLKHNIRNPQTVPLKLGNGWAVCSDHFITIDKDNASQLQKILPITKDNCNEKTIALAEFRLLHELKHYHNYDSAKGCLITFASAVPAIYTYYLHGTKETPIKRMLPQLLILCGVSIASGIQNIRYQENEADRFAFMNISSLKDLELCIQKEKKEAQYFEWQVILNRRFSNRGPLFNYINSLIGNNINSIYQKLIKDRENKHVYLQKTDRLISLANFLFDHKHPSFKHRTALGQECYEQRLALEKLS